jgi:hypothetical protein
VDIKRHKAGAASEAGGHRRQVARPGFEYPERQVELLAKILPNVLKRVTGLC